MILAEKIAYIYTCGTISQLVRVLVHLGQALFIIHEWKPQTIKQFQDKSALEEFLQNIDTIV